MKKLLKASTIPRLERRRATVADKTEETAGGGLEWLLKMGRQLKVSNAERRVADNSRIKRLPGFHDPGATSNY